VYGRYSGNISIIEEDAGWRNFAANTLRARGYTVDVRAHYDETSSHSETGNSLLTILGFSTIGPRELRIIDHVTKHHTPMRVIVVSSSLSSKSMREAFLRGVLDVAQKSFDEVELSDLVRQQTGSETSRTKYVARMRSNENE